ncbi:hypothetical protein N2152v2_006785 [Parachlorella kessleri]
MSEEAGRSPKQNGQIAVCHGQLTREVFPTPAQLQGRPWLTGDPHIKFKFLRVLGTGHYGTTFLCSNLQTGELVAIKALDKHHPEYERELAVQEITILAAVCNQPNIVTLYEVWEDGNYLYLVMEACLGGELFDLILEKGHFTERDAAQIVGVVLQVIEHCHLQGVIHRDLKPENFLLKQQEGELRTCNLRAIDFGLSKFLPPGASCTSCVGSSYYVAPEVLRGCYSWEADLWSIGVITYILLSGFPPFWGSSDYMIFQRILENDVDFDYQPWQQISDPAKDFVARLLEKDPAQRMTLPEALAHPWVTDHSAVPDVPLDPAIFGRLQAFTQQNRVKCLLMTVAARHLSDTAIGDLKDVFSYVDQDHDGMIDMADLTNALAHAGIDMEKQGVAFLLEGLDLAHHSKVHVDEFIAAALDQKKVMTSKTINTIFAQLDQDKDGFLSVEELSRALADCKISIGADTLERLIERQGMLDKQGMISAKSFQTLLLSSDVDAVQLETYLQDVHRFAAANHFKQLAMLVIARNMDASEVEGLRELFYRLDEDGTGTINARQLKDALAHMGKKLKDPLAHMGKKVGESELQHLLEALDLKHHGVIEYDEFLAAALEEQQLVTEAKMRAAFGFFDKTQEGFITKEDLVQVLGEVGMDPAGTPARDGGGGKAPGRNGHAHFSAEELLELADADHDAKITYEDFRRLLLAQPDNALTRAPSIKRLHVRSGSTASSTTLAATAERQPSGLVELVGMIEDAWMTSPKKIIPISPPASRPLRISTPRSSPRTSLDSPGRKAAIAAAVAAASPRSRGSSLAASPRASPAAAWEGPAAAAAAAAAPPRSAGSPFQPQGSLEPPAVMGGGLDMLLSLSRYATAPEALDLQQFSSSGLRSQHASPRLQSLDFATTSPPPASPSAAGGSTASGALSAAAASLSPFAAAQQPERSAAQQQQQRQAGDAMAPAFCVVPTFMLDVPLEEGMPGSQGSLAAPAPSSMGAGFGSILDLHGEHEQHAAAAAGPSGSGSGSLFGPGSGGSLSLGGSLGLACVGSSSGTARAFGSGLYAPGGSLATLQEAGEAGGVDGSAAAAAAGAAKVEDGRPGLLTPGFLLGCCGPPGSDPFGRRPSGVVRESNESTGSDCVAWLGGD